MACMSWRWVESSICPGKASFQGAASRHRNPSESSKLAKILPRMARKARMEVVRYEPVSHPCEIREIRGPILLLAAGRAPPLVRPLWDHQDTQVANAQPLATIRIFSCFSIDIHTYHLYNRPHMVRNEWTDAERRKEGCPSMAPLHWLPQTDCGPVRSRQDEEGCPVRRPPQFLLSAFLFSKFRFYRTLDSSYFEIF
jgi:hypothetical protein